MKILLISTRNNSDSAPVIPIGMLYIAEALRKKNYELKMIDLNFHKEDKTLIRKELDLYKPEFVGLSIRNVAESKSMNKSYDQILSIVNIIKGKAKLILGGAGFSIFPNIIMKLTSAEYGIVGAGEKAIIEIIENSDRIRPHTVFSMEDKDYITSNISEAFKIYWAEYGKFFTLLKADIPIQVVRGCNQKCIYCTYPQINLFKVQKRRIDYVIEEICSIKEYTGINSFYFVDSIFNLDLNFTKALLKSFIKRNINISWKCCINPKNFDLELISLMGEAGCIYCDLGIDSFSDEILSTLKKGFNVSDALTLISTIEQVGITYSISLILGGCGETDETLMETYNIVNGLKKVNKIHAFIGERVYPTTSIADKFSENNEENLLLASKDTVLISNMTKKRLKSIVKNAEKGKWTFSGINNLEEV